jgi:hypothetical protein
MAVLSRSLCSIKPKTKPQNDSGVETSEELAISPDWSTIRIGFTCSSILAHELIGACARIEPTVELEYGQSVCPCYAFIASEKISLFPEIYGKLTVTNILIQQSSFYAQAYCLSG